MNLSEIKDVLNTKDVTPSKKLGQNFLIDANVSKWIVDQLVPTHSDIVVEVGPGTGALTEHLVGRVKKVILVEFDARLAEYQTQKYIDRDDVEVHHCDGARFDTRTLFKYGEVKLLGNLPYSSGGAIMRNFMKQPTCITRAVLMLQKEFIDRIIAVPKTKAYGVLSLRMQAEWESKPIKTVPPEAFHPRPLIDSTVMLCTQLKESHYPVYDLKLYDELIRRGFSQRRKQLKKQLPEQGNWQEISNKLDIIETARAEELSVTQWIEITKAYDSHPLKNIAQDPEELFDIVDENDMVICQKTRAVAHSEKLLHRAVHLFIFNKKKEIFLQKRSRLKDKYPLAWDSSAAGHLNPSETYEAAAIRELDEELGIKLATNDIQNFSKLSPSENTGWEFITLFLARYDGALQYPCSEVKTGMWIDIDELDRWLTKRPQDFATGFIECWHNFRKATQ